MILIKTCVCVCVYHGRRQFNFVEYPPESKKLPSADEIVKMMEQRKSKRLSAQVDATRAALDARLGTRSEATVDANVSFNTQVTPK